MIEYNFFKRTILFFIFLFAQAGILAETGATRVATLTPIIKDLVVANQARDVLWWVLLFGACFGGNLTIIGSTANIIAIGTLEKDRKTTIRFSEWIKIAIVPTIVAMIFALAFFMSAYFLIYR